jgi:hypothetical protein
MVQANGNDDVTLEELETALKITAYCLLRVGPVIAPVLERLEREVATARRDDPRERARRILEGCRMREEAIAMPRSPQRLITIEAISEQADGR